MQAASHKLQAELTDAVWLAANSLQIEVHLIRLAANSLQLKAKKLCLN